EADRLEHERREAGLVLPVEAGALVAPAPPLHVLDRHSAHVGRGPLSGFRRCVLDVGHRVPFLAGATGSGATVRCSSATACRSRFAKSSADSPSAALIGAPKTTVTGNLPGSGQLRPRGIAVLAPTRATGRHGTP